MPYTQTIIADCEETQRLRDESACIVSVLDSLVFMLVCVLACYANKYSVQSADTHQYTQFLALLLGPLLYCATYRSAWSG